MAGPSDRLRERVLAIIPRIKRGRVRSATPGCRGHWHRQDFSMQLEIKNQRSSPASPFLRASLRQAASFGLF